MKKLGILFLVVLIGIGVYLLFINNNNKTPQSNSSASNQQEKQPEAFPSIDASDLTAGGSSFREENGAYSFLYPSDFVLDDTDKQHIRIYKKGGTQQGQTEMYDGVLLVFEVVILDEKALSEWVDNHILSITTDGTSVITEPKKEVTLKNYHGITYATRGLGESKNYIFQKNTNSKSAILISTAVNDPGSVGFQKEVDKIISTLEVLK